MWWSSQCKYWNWMEGTWFVLLWHWEGTWEKSEGHSDTFTWHPEMFYTTKYASYRDILCTLCPQRTESLTIVPPQHLAQPWLMSYKKYHHFLSTQEMRIWHEIVQGQINRFVVLTSWGETPFSKSYPLSSAECWPGIWSSWIQQRC